MSFNVNNFIANLGKHYIANVDNFEVIISKIPEKLYSSEVGFDYRTIQEHLALRCSEVDIPGTQVTTMEHTYYGPTKKIAYGKLFSDVNATFILSENFVEKVFFEEWQGLVANYKHNRPNTVRNYNIAYYKNYIGEVVIRQYTEAEDKELIYECKLLDAYPINISGLQGSWTGEDYHRLQVTFAYKEWTRTFWNDRAYQYAIRRRPNRLLNTLGAGANVIGAGIVGNLLSR